jgi:hypothetical protein
MLLYLMQKKKLFETQKSVFKNIKMTNFVSNETNFLHLELETVMIYKYILKYN